jgi:hypothetical protein
MNWQSYSVISSFQAQVETGYPIVNRRPFVDYFSETLSRPPGGQLGAPSKVSGAIESSISCKKMKECFTRRVRKNCGARRQCQALKFNILVNSYLLYHHLAEQGLLTFSSGHYGLSLRLLTVPGRGIPAAKDSKKKNFFFYVRSGIASRNLFWLASGEDPRVFGEGNQSAPQLSESRTDPDI